MRRALTSSLLATAARLSGLREPAWRAIVPVLLIMLWQAASSLGVASEFVLPSPASVRRAVSNSAPVTRW